MARGFSKKQREGMIKDQGGKCFECGKRITLKNSQGDHYLPYKLVRSTNSFNGQQLCTVCHKRKTKQQNRDWVSLPKCSFFG